MAKKQTNEKIVTESLKNEKLNIRKRRSKTLLILLCTLIPLAVIGLSLGLVFGLGTSYKITTTAGENGTVVVTSDDMNMKTEDNVYTISGGKTATVTITPNTGYSIATITVNDEEVDITVEEGQPQTITFENLDKEQTISATFEMRYFGIVVTQPTNGTITPTSVEDSPYGTVVTFRITPNEAYKVTAVVVNGISTSVTSATDAYYDYQVTVTTTTTFTATMGFSSVNGYVFSPEGDRIIVDPDNENYTTNEESTALIGKDEDGLLKVLVAVAPNATSVSIPASVHTIGERAFQNVNLVTLDLTGTSIVRIMGYAFSGSNLQQIILPSSLTTLDANALGSMNDLVQIVLNSTLNSNYTLPSVSAYNSLVRAWYKEGENPTEVTELFSSGTYYVGYTGQTTSGESITNTIYTTTAGWQYCLADSHWYISGVPGGSGSLTIPATLATQQHGNINIYGVGNNNFTLTNIYNYSTIVLANGIKSIGNWTFDDCSSLTSITIPDSVTSIRYYAFWDCSGLTSITIPDSVTSIGGGAFYGCTGLTSITIPDSVTSIGDYTFEGCTSLISINVSSSNANYSSVDGVLFNKNQTTIIAYPNAKGNSYIIPSNVTSIGYAFGGCSGLTSITIPNSVTSIGSSAFYGCTGLISINVSSSNANYSSVDGVLFNKNQTTIIAYPNAKGNSSYIIPSSVTNIGDNAFLRCSSLTAITFGEDSQLESIGTNAFFGCSSLTSITIPSSVTNIGNSVFSGCTSLTSITIPSSVTNIGNNAFRSCTSLTSITIPNSVTSIGDFAFYGCSSLTSITINSNITTFESGIFNNCPSLTNLTIGAGVTSLPNNFFQDLTHLTTITVDPANTQFKVIASIAEPGKYELYEKDGSGNFTILRRNGLIGTLTEIDETTGLIYTVSIEGEEYSAAIIGYTGSATEVTIPELFTNTNYPEAAEITISSISPTTFDGNSTVTTVNIPSSILMELVTINEGTSYFREDITVVAVQ